MASYDYDKSYIAVEDEINELTGHIDDLCFLNLHEATEMLEYGLSDETKTIISNRRSDHMIKCIKSLDKIKILIKELKWKDYIKINVDIQMNHI